MIRDHDNMRDLVAAYALDALDDDERAEVEDHLRDCPRCRSELAGHQEAAALLAYSGTEAPVGVWERIVEGIAAPPAPPRLSMVVGSGGRTPGAGARDRGRGRRRWPYGLAGAAAAVAAAVIAVMGVSLVHQDHRLNQMSVAVAQQAVLGQATAAALDPAARRVALATPEGRTAATAAILPNGTGYVLAGALPALPRNRTYQLWSIGPGRTVSAGVLGPVPTVHRFRVGPGATTLAITDEPAGGSPQPTSAPLAAGLV